jgi:hypothetical protein
VLETAKRRLLARSGYPAAKAREVNVCYRASASARSQQRVGICRHPRLFGKRTFATDPALYNVVFFDMSFFCTIGG